MWRYLSKKYNTPKARRSPTQNQDAPAMFAYIHQNRMEVSQVCFRVFRSWRLRLRSDRLDYVCPYLRKASRRDGIFFLTGSPLFNQKVILGNLNL